MQIQISWLLQKSTDLDLHCLLRQGMTFSAREGLRETATFSGEKTLAQGTCLFSKKGIYSKKKEFSPLWSKCFSFGINHHSSLHVLLLLQTHTTTTTNSPIYMGNMQNIAENMSSSHVDQATYMSSLIWIIVMH